MKYVLFAVTSLASFARLACGSPGTPCPVGETCTPAIEVSMPSLPPADFTNQPLHGNACVNGASCVGFDISLDGGHVTCSLDSGSGAQCTGSTDTFTLTIPAGNANGAEGASVRLTLTDTQQQVVFDKTAPAAGGPPLGCGDCWAGYVTY